MTLREIMKPVVMTIRGSHSCYEAALRMARANVHHLPVVDDQERLVGIISDRDLRSHLMMAMGTDDDRPAVATRKVLEDVTVRTVMTDAVIAGHPDMAVGDAVRTMAGHKLGSLPIVDDGRLVGIVTERDLLLRLRASASPCGEAIDRILLAA